MRYAEEFERHFNRGEGAEKAAWAALTLGRRPWLVSRKYEAQGWTRANQQ
jgi:hypothetical protein